MTIAEVSKKYELSADTLRYYERIGLIPPVGRTKGGIRNYSQEDCNWVEFMKHMRYAGISIEGLIEYVRLFHEGDSTTQARKEILTDEREKLSQRLADMQATLDRLDKKIAHYEKCESFQKERLEK